MKKCNYLVITVLSAICAIVVYFLVPTYYSAHIKLCDEYKETDLSVGLNSLSAQLKDMLKKGNSGVNDMEIYLKRLKSDDFARVLSSKQLDGRKISYGQHLGNSDTVEVIKNNLHYVYSSLNNSVTIEFKDKDPLIAAQMLDSVVVELQRYVTKSRHNSTLANAANAKKSCRDAKQAYETAQRNYAAFVESHSDAVLQQETQKIEFLKKEVDDKFALYQKSLEKYTRERLLLQRPYMSFAIVQNVTVPNKPSKNVIAYVLAFVFMANLLAFGWNTYIRKKPKSLGVRGDIFSPWFLTIGIWGVDLILCFLQKDMLYPIQKQFWYCLLLWMPLFVVSSMLASSLAKSEDPAAQYNGTPHVNRLPFNVLWGISMCLSPLFLYKVMTIVMQFDTENLLYNIRLLAVSGEGSSLILNSVQAINIALFITCIWLYPKISKVRFASVIIAFIIVEFAMMEKSGILIMVLSTLFVLHQKKVIRVRTIALVLMITVVLFFFINMSKEEKDAESVTFLEFFGMYITTPAVAFSYISQDITSQFGMNTFAQVYQYMNVFGFNFDYVNRIQEFMLVPIPTNVYTIFQPFFQDFGELGVGYFAVVYGSLFGWIYGKYRSGNSFCKLLYTYLVEVILIQFYNENLLQNLFLSVGFVFWSFVLTQDIIIIKKK